MSPQTKKYVLTWAAFLVVAQSILWAMNNDHDTLAMWLVLLAVVLFSLQRIVKYGDAAAAGKCPHCRGKVKAKASTCGKCGTVVRGPAVGA